MATKEEKKKSRSRDGSLKSIATAGTPGRYSKYGDISPSSVHSGDAVYRGVTLTDAPGVNVNSYRLHVNRGHGKPYFRFQNKLYKVTGSGSGQEEVKV